MDQKQMKTEIEDLKKNQVEILKLLDSILQFLQGRIQSGFGTSSTMIVYRQEIQKRIDAINKELE